MCVYLKINNHFRCCISNALHELTPKSANQPARHKSRTKIVFFFKKNMVSHMTFVGRPTILAGHIVCALLMLKL